MSLLELAISSLAAIFLYAARFRREPDVEYDDSEFLFDMWEYEHAKTCRQCARIDSNEYDGSMCAFAYARYLDFVNGQAK